MRKKVIINSKREVSKPPGEIIYVDLRSVNSSRIGGERYWLLGVDE